MEMLFSSTCHNNEGIMTNNSNLVAGKRLQTLYTSSYVSCDKICKTSAIKMYTASVLNMLDADKCCRQCPSN